MKEPVADTSVIPAIAASPADTKSTAEWSPSSIDGVPQTPLCAVNTSAPSGSSGNTDGNHAFSGNAATFNEKVTGAARLPMKRQLEVLEETVTLQLMSLRQNSERLATRAATHLEARLSEHDVQLAQLTGKLKGLVGESNAQVGRLDGFEARLWEWRKVLEEHVDARIACIESELHSKISKVEDGVSSGQQLIERHAQQLQRLEDFMDDLSAPSSFQSLPERVARLEVDIQGSVDSEAPLEPLVRDESWCGLRLQAAGDDVIRDPAVFSLEQKATECAGKVEWIQREVLESQSRLEEHEVRLASVRCRLDASDERQRVLVDQFCGLDLEARVKSMQQDLLQQSECQERLEKRTEELECAQREWGAEVVEVVHGEYNRLVGGLVEGLCPRDSLVDSSSSLGGADPLFRPCLVEPFSLHEELQGGASGMHGVARREATRVVERAIRHLRAELGLLPRHADAIPQLPSGEPQKAVCDPSSNEEPTANLKDFDQASLQTDGQFQNGIGEHGPAAQEQPT